MGQELYVYEKNGKRRKAIETVCKTCNKTFLSRQDKSQTYCSQECRGKGLQKTHALICYNCGKEFVRKNKNLRNSKSGINFCCRECKDFSQSVLGNCKEIQPSHYGKNTSGDVKNRKDVQLLFANGCVGCGITLKYLLNTHHIDGNRQNNKKENIEIVCCNCHVKRHLKCIDGEWFYDTHYLTPRDMLDKV